MRTETSVGLFLNVSGIFLSQANFLPDFAAGFSAGLFTSLGIFFLVVGLLPEKAYDKLAYRKFFTK